MSETEILHPPAGTSAVEPAQATASPAITTRWRRVAARLLSVVIVALLVWTGFQLHDSPQYGKEGSFALIAGAAFGVVLQRSRFCFLCNLKDLFTRRAAGPVLGILTALAVGSVGYLVVLGAWVVDPTLGFLPPNAFIAPLGWHVAAGGLIFGLGMALSGSCISAHLYRLGEGSLLAPIALIGAAGGFLIGFRWWEWWYVNVVSESPIVWTPRYLGYVGAAAVQLGGIALIALLLWRFSVTAPSASPTPRRTFGQAFSAIFVTRWPSWVGGAAVGVLATFVLLRTEPLGVTAELGRLTRLAGTSLEVIPDRLPGLDSLRGCRTASTGAAVVSRNGIFVLALIAGSFVSALLARQFKPKRESIKSIAFALVGGVLLGIGAMIALGCSVGTLLSGVMAFSASGWAFAITMTLGVYLGLQLRRVIG